MKNKIPLPIIYANYQSFLKFHLLFMMLQFFHLLHMVRMQQRILQIYLIHLLYILILTHPQIKEMVYPIYILFPKMLRMLSIYVRIMGAVLLNQYQFIHFSVTFSFSLSIIRCLSIVTVF